MKARAIAAVTLVAALLTVGLTPALATGEKWWGGEGTFEPSTTYDTPEYMQQYANNKRHPADVEERVYFNGFLMNEDYGTQLEGGTLKTGSSRFAAMLGFWRDCNNDGYIGAKNAPTPYGNWNAGYYPRGVYGEDFTICPPGSPYNTHTFIDEFRWIGPAAAPPREVVNGQGTCDPTDWTTYIQWCIRQWGDPEDVTDSEARVWADWNRPDAPAANTGYLISETTWSNLSGTLAQVNFLTGAERRLNNADQTQAQVTGTPLPVGWDDLPNFGACEGSTTFGGGPDGQCGMYPLWQAKRLVNDSQGEGDDPEPFVGVFDTETDDGGETNSPCDDAQIGPVAIPDIHPTFTSDPLMEGSIGGTVQNIREGTNDGRFDGQCGHYYPVGFGDEDEDAVGKKSRDDSLYFFKDKRFQTAAGVGVTYVPADLLGTFGGPSGPSGLYPWYGTWVIGSTSSGPRWLSGGWTHLAIVPAIQSPLFATLYADVTQEAFDNAGLGTSGATLPAGSDNAHEYGGTQCPGGFDDTAANREPNQFGWVCSELAWREYFASRADTDPDGTRAMKLIRPGTPFDLRDVDCYDHTPASGTENFNNDVTIPGGATIRKSCDDWRV